jgi:hypothetical protein
MNTRSSKNNSNNNGGGDEQQQQLGRGARKRSLNQLANDGKPAVGEDQQEPEECSSKNSRRDGKNDQDLKVCSLYIVGLEVQKELLSAITRQKSII